MCRSLQVSQVQHAASGPFNLSIYFVAFFMASFLVVSDCGILEKTN